MPITLTVDGDYTLDESSTLQNGPDGTPSGTPRDDSDVDVTTLPTAFYDYLFTDLALDDTFPTLVGAAESASGIINVTADTPIDTFGITGLNGAVLDGTQSSGLFTTDGDEIFLWSAMDGQAVLGKTAGGDVVFAVYMEPGTTVDGSTDYTLWSVTFEALADPDNPDQDEAVDLLQNAYITATGSKEFNFDELPSGNNLFGMVGDESDAILVIGALPVLKNDGTYVTGGSNPSDTINTSKGGGPTTIGVDNQAFNDNTAAAGKPVPPNDGAFFTYVEDPNPAYLAGATNGLDQNEADDADNCQFGDTKEVHGAFLKIVQVTGAGNAALSLTAYDIDTTSTLNDPGTNADDLNARNFVLSDMGNADDQVDITHVWVYSGAIEGPGSVLIEESGQNLSALVDITIDGNGVAHITNLQDGYFVVWETTDVHDQVQVTAEDGSDPFDIGLFGVLEGAVVSESLAGHAFVEDDGPSIGPVDDGLVQFVAGDFDTHSLNGDTGNDGGSYAITDFTASFSYLGITVIGEQTSDTEVLYFQDKGGTVGSYDAGTDLLYYTLALDETGSGSYTFTVNNAPEAPPLEFDFAGLPSGQNLFGMVADSGDPDGPGALFFGEHAVIGANGVFTNASDTINTSKGGGPTTIGVNNQMIDPGDGVYFTLINDPEDAYLANVSGGLNQNEADDADNMQFDSLKEVGSAFFRVSQTQGNAVEACTVEAFNITDTVDPSDLIAASGQNHVDLVSVSVWSDAVGGTLLETTVGGADGGQSSIDVFIDGDGIAHITGLEAGYVVSWETDGVDKFDQVLIEGTAGKFDIGGIGISEPQAIPDQTLTFDVTLTDGDSDPITDTFQVYVDAVPYLP
jgi:hypothetical protein